MGKRFHQTGACHSFIVVENKEFTRGERLGEGSVGDHSDPDIRSVKSPTVFALLSCSVGRIVTKTAQLPI